MQRPWFLRSLSSVVGLALIVMLASCGVRGSDDEAETTSTARRPTTTRAARPTQPPTTEAASTPSTTTAAPATTAPALPPQAEAQQALNAALDPLNSTIASWETGQGSAPETPVLITRWCATLGPSLTRAADALQSRNQWAGAEGQVSLLAVSTRAEAALHAECAAAPATYAALDPILARLRAAEDRSVAAADAARVALGLPGD
ncbi:MAG TPA: hypothetical protein VJM33_08900 [Microthrixaceae bacterium]|nr:hypothetical protein [Microthrixaceae bacterium]